MISASTKIFTPEGWKEARHIKAGDLIYSWRSRRWFENAVEKVGGGMARSLMSILCLDGIAPTVFNCTPDQEICRKWAGRMKASRLHPGDDVMASEGVHVFTAEIAMIETVDSLEPQPMVGFELSKHRPYLAGGLLCR